MKRNQILFRNSILHSSAILLIISIFGNYSSQFCLDREWDTEGKSFFFDSYPTEGQSCRSEEETIDYMMGKFIMAYKPTQGSMALSYGTGFHKAVASHLCGQDMLTSDMLHITPDLGNESFISDETLYSSFSSGFVFRIMPGRYDTPELIDGFLNVIKMPDRHSRFFI